MTASPAYHVPVLPDAVVSLLRPVPPGLVVDGTLGGGGHTALLVDALSADHHVVGVDQDPDALEAAGARLAGKNVTFLRGNFRALPALIARHFGAGAQISGLLLDLGVSSWQLDAPARGFAIKHPDAPLDMRMDPSGDRPTARELIEELDESELARVLRDLGEVEQAHRVARALKQAADGGEIVTSGDLSRVLATVQKTPRHGKIHPATLVFQALRIAVNDELGALDDALSFAPDLLEDGGRLVVIAYHSLEDRRVKHAFRAGEQGPERPRGLPAPTGWAPTWRAVGKAVTADDAEIARNPRARSARLRCAERAPRPEVAA
ncbi:MAG: 16S rRNA (cytosine(1402)-N(4))-methyltransferase RsmH [Myxococcales bacterium]|nr:16S rRNA (cytosine(1402)-N(4))-methyltransferase RsmH [Myxococcales bacterium]MCB9731334.1 16S rRNA (cytosine(1402)-N(4))-methyltransferase RsmH [Deltaproteobacteria bacterium]